MEQMIRMIGRRVLLWFKRNWMLLVAVAIIIYLMTWIKPVN